MEEYKVGTEGKKEGMEEGEGEERGGGRDYRWTIVIQK